ncbi:MAG TPA: hypothetical protein DCF33_07810 [Saprospirales bacterium]|nr:hypothetical protein [Saprospirales bacterium]
MARDLFHQEVKEALIKDGWQVTDDPLSFKIGKMQVQIDLGAERLIAAEKNSERIAIEIKTFGSLSFITALYEAVGKYIIYRNVLKQIQPDRVLFLALPESIFDRFFDESVIKETIFEERINLILYNQTDKLITKWIK